MLQFQVPGGLDFSGSDRFARLAGKDAAPAGRDLLVPGDDFGGGEMTDSFSMQWSQFGAAVAAVGSLGVAAFGVVESLGKAFAFTFNVGKERRLIHFGLPYVGLGTVNRMTKPLRTALRCAYGDGYAEIIAQQYRADRSDGSAPDTIRQGVRLGLPFLGVEKAAELIAEVWHMDHKFSLGLAQALQADAESPPPSGGVAAAGAAPKGTIDQHQALAGRFATALDARIKAAFQIADEQYEATAKALSGLAAVGLAVLFNWGLTVAGKPPLSWVEAIGVGLVAVPLAPVAKDLSTSLQNALTAFKSISTKSV